VYSLDEIDALDTAALLKLQPAPDAADYEDVLQQQGLPHDVTADEVFMPADLKVNQLTCATPVAPVMKPPAVKSGMSSSLLRRLLRYSLPLPLLLIVLFGGLYLLCDWWNEALNDLGLIISPQLKYVRGTPPV